MNYPTSAPEKGEYGTVLIQFVVGEFGQVSEVKQINSGVSTALVEESKRVVLSTNGMWIPASKDGLKVSMIYTTPVKFQLF